MTEQEGKDKFRRLPGKKLDKIIIEEIVKAVDGLKTMKEISALMGILRKENIL